MSIYRIHIRNFGLIKMTNLIDKSLKEKIRDKILELERYIPKNLKEFEEREQQIGRLLELL